MYVRDGFSKGATRSSFRRNQSDSAIIGTTATRSALRSSLLIRKKSATPARRDIPISRVNTPKVTARSRKRNQNSRESSRSTTFSMNRNERIRNRAKGTSERISVENRRNKGLIARKRHPINAGQLPSRYP